MVLTFAYIAAARISSESLKQASVRGNDLQYLSETWKLVDVSQP
jgi:hypothetical protein